MRPKDLDSTIASIKKDIEFMERTQNGRTPEDKLVGTQVHRDHGTVKASNIDSVHCFKKAGFLERLFSYIIDSFILFAISVALAISTFYLMGEAFMDAIEDPQIMAKGINGPFILVVSLIQAFYFTYFHSVTGQTVGKWLIGIKVVNNKGETLGFIRSFFRFAGYILSLYSFCIGFIWIIFDRNCQGWHDKIAGSYVIRF